MVDSGSHHFYWFMNHVPEGLRTNYSTKELMWSISEHSKHATIASMCFTTKGIATSQSSTSLFRMPNGLREAANGRRREPLAPPPRPRPSSARRLLARALKLLCCQFNLMPSRSRPTDHRAHHSRRRRRRIGLPKRGVQNNASSSAATAAKTERAEREREREREPSSS